MKIKNHYAWLCAIWIIATICDSVSCAVNFINGEIVFGFMFLVMSVGFSFVSGILLNKAVAVYNHNKEVEWLEEIAETLYDDIEPFEEFDNEN